MHLLVNSTISESRDVIASDTNNIVDLKSDVAITFRGGIIENTHRIHAAIVNSKGELQYAVGDPERITLARSAAKPFQTLAILETGAAERFKFDDADVALMCASHSSESRHISRAQEMLKKAEVEEEKLACGGHPSLSAAVNHAWIKQDYMPTGIDNNCSGKHAGMVAGAICLGDLVHGYHEPQHAMQQRVKQVTEEMSDLSENEIHWAVDGCNLPAPALPLRNLALMYSRLAEACSGHIEDTSAWQISSTLKGSDKRRELLARIHKSMATHPDMVGGEGRFCTTLMETYRGMLVGKLGADGCYGVAIRASPDTSLDEGNTGSAIGIAVKVEDGNIDILYSAVMEILEKLNIGTSCMREELYSFHHPTIINTAGVVTGTVEQRLTVRKC